MKNVLQIIHLIRKNWIRYFIISMVLFTMAALFLRYITPQQEVPEEPPMISALGALNETVSFEYIGPSPEYPSEMTMYEGATLPLDGRQLANQIAKKLQIPKETNAGLNNMWTNYQTRESIDYRPASNEIYYIQQTSHAEESEPTALFGFNIDRAVAESQSFIQKIELYSSIEPDTDRISYHAHENESVSLEEAEFIEIPFKIMLDGYPLLWDTTYKPVLSIRVNKEYEVTRAVFYPPPPAPVPLKTRATISSNTLIQALNGGKGQLIVVSAPIGWDKADISHVRLTEYAIEYRFDSNTRVFLPYARFSGTANNGQFSKVEFLLPLTGSTQ